MRLNAKGIGAVNGRLLVATAEKIPPSELIDTTGAGDAFIGATLYGMFNQFVLIRVLATFIICLVSFSGQDIMEIF